MNLTEEQKQLLEELKSGDAERQLKAWQKISEDRELLIYAYRNDYTNSLSNILKNINSLLKK